VRYRKAALPARVNRPLTLRFTAAGLTSYSGLELFGRFLRGLDFSARLRRHLRTCDPAADFSSVTLVRLLVAMFVIGARRLRHVRYLGPDPVLQRFCGLTHLPSERTLSRWLTRCSAPVRAALAALNGEVIAESVRPLGLRRATIDIDGTVVSTGLHVERAFRGYNPHHRKVPSYYPITAYLAQTGHVVRVQNRSGNVHDGKASLPFLRDLFAQLATMLPGVRLPAEREPGRRQDHRGVRMDLPDALDERPGAIQITARPGVVDEDVGALSEIAPPSSEDGALVPSRPAAFDHVVAQATQRVDLLAGQVEIVVDDEDASHLMPPAIRRPVRVSRCVRMSLGAHDRTTEGPTSPI